MSKKNKSTLKVQLKKVKIRLSKLQTKFSLASLRIKDALENSTPVLNGALLGLTLFIFMSAVSTITPHLHRSYIRSKVGKKVYVVRGAYDSRGGGTGFAVKGSSGKSYVLTNDHVCAASKDGATMFVHDDSGVGIPRLILERSVYSDLCLLEGVPGVDGLEMADKPDLGQLLFAVGHPNLMPLHVAEGHMIGIQTLLIPLGLVSMNLKCDQPKNEAIPLITLLFGVKADEKYNGPVVCLERIKDAYLTNIRIQPGNSGSPVVDFYGNVVAVAFASDAFGWGMLVSNEDLKTFLAWY